MTILHNGTHVVKWVYSVLESDPSSSGTQDGQPRGPHQLIVARTNPVYVFLPVVTRNSSQCTSTQIGIECFVTGRKIYEIRESMSSPTPTPPNELRFSTSDVTRY